MSSLNNHLLIQQYIEQNQFGKLIDFKFHIKSPGIVEYVVHVQSKHLATPLAAHGGMIASLMDATLGVGALSMVCEANEVVSTIDLHVTFLNPVIEGDTLTSISTVVKVGKRILFMEASATNQHGALVAKAHACLNRYPKANAGY
jgi:uncharacterized protein (TIGR00369 family)